MKLSQETVGVLKNFASISSGIFVPGGNVLRVKDAKQRILAEAVIQENFPSFCVADLSKFMSVMTMDKDAEVDFKGSDIVIKTLSGKSKISYRGSPKNLVNYPEEVKVDAIKSQFEKMKVQVSFDLSQETMEYLDKVVSLLSLPKVAVEPDGKRLILRAFDPTNDSENQQVIEVDKLNAEVGKFQVIFDKEILQFVEGDYTVKIAEGLACFKHKKLNLSYYLAPELGSTYMVNDK